MRIVESTVKLMQISSDPAQLIERAGRTCYKSEDRITDNSAEKFVAMIVERGHVSVIEHGYASFRIVCDRGITHEIVRHRIASYSQESTRYCNYGKDKFDNQISVIAPYGICEGNPDGSWEVWASAMLQAEKTYFELLETGHKPQIARSVLPTCLKAEIVMTANLREWSWFLEKRLSAAAHPDMRRVAGRVGEILLESCPPVFRAWSKSIKEVRNSIGLVPVAV